MIIYESLKKVRVLTDVLDAQYKKYHFKIHPLEPLRCTTFTSVSSSTIKSVSYTETQRCAFYHI